MQAERAQIFVQNEAKLQNHTHIKAECAYVCVCVCEEEQSASNELRSIINTKLDLLKLQKQQKTIVSLSKLETTDGY